MNPSTIISRLAHGIACVILMLVIGLTAATAGATPIPTVSAEPDFAAIDMFIEKEMQAQSIPGLALGIVQGNQIVYLKGYGIADPAGRAVTPQTPFILGSTTKSFTSLAIMQLVEAGKLDLDISVQRYLPWFQVADADAAQITVRQLLTHTSGLTKQAGIAHSDSAEIGDGALEQRVRSLASTPLNGPAGATYEYSNANYETLGLIVQIVAGESYEAYIQQHIFAPLEMRYSFTSQADAQRQGLAIGYRYWFGRPMPANLAYNRGDIPAGYLIASAEDLTHYLIAQLNDGNYQGTSVLSHAGLAELHRPAVPVSDAALQLDKDTFYGMGWYIGPTNGVPTISHGGNLANYHSDLLLIPNGQWGVVVLTNANSELEKARTYGFAVGVTSLLMGRQPPALTIDSDAPVLEGLILAPTALLLIGTIASLLALRRWCAEPARRPHGRHGISLRVLLPCTLNLALGLYFLVGLPVLFEMRLPVFVLMVPDLGYTQVVSGVLALVWSVVWLAVAGLLLRKPLRPHPVGAPVKA